MECIISHSYRDISCNLRNIHSTLHLPSTTLPINQSTFIRTLEIYTYATVNVHTPLKKRWGAIDRRHVEGRRGGGKGGQINTNKQKLGKKKRKIGEKETQQKKNN